MVYGFGVLRMGVCSTPKNGLLERGNLDLAERSLKMLRGEVWIHVCKHLIYLGSIMNL